MYSNDPQHKNIFCVVLYFILEDEAESKQQTEKSTNKKTSADSVSITGSSITWKSLRSNLIRPEESTVNDLLEGHKKKPMSGIVNPKFTSPASLPLYFYFGFQLLQESDLLQKCGHVCLQIKITSK